MTFRRCLHQIRNALGLAWLMTITVYAVSPGNPVYEKVISFSDAAVSGTTGIAVMGGLTLGPDGNFYGTSGGGGSSNNGTVFKITASGVLTTLMSFNGNNGSDPQAGLTLGNDGNFYGTTSAGGSTGNGTVFKVTPLGILTVLMNFTSSTGTNPVAPLVQGSDGNFYGTTKYGGSSYGTIFKISPAGVFTTLFSFNGTNGSTVYSGLVQGQAPDTNFYGMTGSGGSANDGTIFKITPAGALMTLFTFTGANGASPTSNLILGSDGNFHGMTTYGGTSSDGTVFTMTSTGSLTTQVNFNGTNGANPQGPLFEGSDGNYYGTTEFNGAYGYGNVFNVTPSGVLNVLASFNGTNGSYPLAGLIQGVDGNYYGTTVAGAGSGISGASVFKMSPSGVLTTLVNFNSNVGSSSVGGLVQDSSGNFYGTTYSGGSFGYGTIFKVTYAGVLTFLVNFSGTNGANPGAGLVSGGDGNFYGTTTSGTVFKVTPAGALSTLATFNGTNGTSPRASLVLGIDGSFYGTTHDGGSSSSGTVFKVTPAGVLTTLVNFNYSNGANPLSSLVQGTGNDTNFYGTTDSASGTGNSGYGTVFKMTPTGTLTTLYSFSSSTGYDPGAGLVLGTDSSFYGTTEAGGSSSNGTAFKITSAGALTPLASFNGTNGSNPAANLIQASDGNFYGTTQYGGSAGVGTVFQMTTAGALTTIYDFANDTLNSSPQAPLFQAADGNLYGTTHGGSGGFGCIYRIIMPGKPTIYPNSPVVENTTSTLISCLANARGSTTSVSVQYGTDGVTFPFSASIATDFEGSTTTPLGTTLTNLTPGTTYYYQITATNGRGTTTTSPLASFSTLEAPSATVQAPTNLAASGGSASAQLNGTVNAFNYAAGVVFQYGTDGQNFPNQIGATQGTPAGTITGSGNTAVSAPVMGLAPATTYYYRIIATNAGGTTISGTTSFTTLTAPVAAVLPATLVTGQSAQLNGTVNAEGASSMVTIEYGTDGVNFPNSVGAGTVAGSSTGAVPVSAVISSASTLLVPGTTYYYRVRAISAGGTAVSPSASFMLDILSGFARQFPNAPPSTQGIVLVNLSPLGLNTGWRFVGEQLWRTSGVPAFGLVTGDYTIQYEPVPGYLQPPSQTFSVVSGGAATVDNETYYPAAAGGPSGGLSVQLVPQNLTGTGWRFYGETAWRANNSTVSNLVPGNYLVQCEPVPGQTTPAVASVTVTGGQTSIVTLTYLVASTAVGAQPAVLPFATVTNSQTPSLPYAFVGQIRSDEGSATGFVVSERVVATAGHVVFDGVTNAYVTGLQWLFERSAGTYEPVPQIPQGAYLFDGYAALAHADAQADAQSGLSTENASPPAQNLDAAALYFFADAGNGGYGGYLASISNPSEFLASVAGMPNTRLKTLVGYPVDGIPAANQGQMFATPPVVATFTQVNGTDSSGDPDTNGKPYQLYTTSSLTSVGGNSGGPLCVQYDDDNYYPAAIYLGGSGQTVVRAIDSAVIDLFNRAQVSGAGGANQVGGGVTQANTTISGGTFASSSLLVNFAPGPVASSASWMVGSTTGTARGNGVQLNNLTPGNYTLYFTAVSGFYAPAPYPVTLTGGQLSTVTVTYEGIIGQPQDVTTLTGGDATFTVAASGTPMAYQWERNGINVSGATSASYTCSSVAASDAGSYNVMVTWSDGSFPSSTAALNVSSALTAQTITFSALAGKAFGAAPFALTASASSGLAVTYNVLSGPATVSGSTLTLTGTGTVVVQASQSGNATFASAAMVSQSFIVNPATQAITFPAIASQPLSVAPFLLSASASSGLPVSFSLVSGPASLQGNTLSVTGAGTVVVQASQPGNSNFAAAANVNQSFLVGPAPINDTPTLPAWALALLALFFVLSGTSHLTRCHRCSSA